MDPVRKSEYARLTGPGRRFIKGQKYALLSRWRNLTLSGRKGLKLLFNANKRLHTAYLLKESFEKLWSCDTPGWARRFFDNWRESLKWQRLKPYEKFAAMIEKHWDGIAAYCHADNKVAPGFVEGLPEWAGGGCLDDIQAAVVEELDELGLLDWDQLLADATFVRAKKG